MNELSAYKVHPVADLFPLIEGDAFTELVQDIRTNGLLHEIILTPDGTAIVDGRNRERACHEGRVDPRYRKLGPHYTEEMIIAYIMSQNLQRRHLEPGQRAMVGFKLLPFYEQIAREKQRAAGGDRTTREGKAKKKLEGNGPRALEADLPHALDRAPQARDQAAKAVGVGGKSIDKAKTVAQNSPALAAKVTAGTTSLDAAYKEAKAKPKPPKDSKPAPSGKGGTRRAEPVTLQLPTHDGQLISYPKPQGKPHFNKTNKNVDWAAWTWNPVTGCIHGCSFCYARELANLPSYASAYPVGFTPLFHHERLDAPANTDVPEEADADERLRRVFVCSMADLYGKWVPQDWIDQVHASCIANPQWDYLLLTKFPKRYVGLELPETAWVGTSVDTQKRVRLAEEAFRQIKNVRVRWLSLEPLLEPLEFSDLSMFDWVVIGSQTATEQPDGPVPAFAPDFEWVSRIVGQAREVGCRVYLKPNLLGEVGPQSPGMLLPREEPRFRSARQIVDKGGQLRLVSSGG
jgi:protein gp37